MLLCVFHIPPCRFQDGPHQRSTAAAVFVPMLLSNDSKLPSRAAQWPFLTARLWEGYEGARAPAML